MLYIKFEKSFNIVNNTAETAGDNAAVYFKDGGCVVAPAGGLEGATFIGLLAQEDGPYVEPEVLSMEDLPD